MDLLRRLDGQGATMVGHAVLARTMGQTRSAASGAGVQAGSLQLPHGATALISTLLGYFTLRDRHI